MMNTHALLSATVARPVRIERSGRLSPADRRRLGLVLGFLAGLAAFGPVVALGTAAAAVLLVRAFDPRK